MIYFDYAATTPIDEEVLVIYQQVAAHYWGNTSSLHHIGGEAKQVLENSRKSLATLLHVPPRGIYFTSSGTESNQLAIVSLALSQSYKGKHIITSQAEHSSVFSALSYLENKGFEVTKIPYTKDGQVDLLQLEKAIRSDTIMTTIGYVNSEIGSIQPLEKIRQLLHAEIIFHTDAVQAFGKVDLSNLHKVVDSFSISSHKLYGPKGVGAVYIQPRFAIKGIFPLQTHEHGIRGGTVNTPGIAAFAAAALKYVGEEWDSAIKLRRLFLAALKRELKSQQQVIESSVSQLPHIVGLTLPNYEGQLIMLECNRKGFCISTGTACGRASSTAGKTMVAMGYSEERQKEFIRISFGKDTSENDIVQLVQVLKEIVVGNKEIGDKDCEKRKNCSVKSEGI
ncbi:MULTISPECIES: IscS subfamily cysteine desulfurase [Clostridia]|uniref:cysteine desulfurase family protein n=1 Tax=Clostridia TaxID=186801 RepID=UPI000EA2858C|nr:IscS subfamily cysteine desulfurase [Clostridium sp. 1xD42-85]NBJ68018.1 aminotransferase class V-fold PLP-dependent enzyme [Roseburia sp. 1XD42-34]RKI82459.1 aminotransferase class V-fold PLP-dependent enzyme [Clostridium sp. 1xD42-85]